MKQSGSKKKRLSRSAGSSKASSRARGATEKGGATRPARAASRPPASQRASTASGLVATVRAKVSEAGTGAANLATDGAQAARRGLERVSKTTRKGLRKMDQSWHDMDTAHKVGVAAGVLGALAAAAAAPAIARQLKKK